MLLHTKLRSALVWEAREDLALLMITNVNADRIKQWSGLYFGQDGHY